MPEFSYPFNNSCSLSQPSSGLLPRVTSVCVAALLIVFMCLAGSVLAYTTVESAGQAGVVVAEPSGITQKPRWEFGVGGGYLAGFDYPASGSTNERGIALPFFIYRSPRLRVGDGGVRAVAIENPRFKLDLTVGGALNANSDGNSARQGMPDLDFLFEIGPQLEVRLMDRRLETGARLRMRFTSDVRAVFSTDFEGVDSRGLVADLGVGVNLGDIGTSGVSLLGRFNASFATERLHDYFYQVDAEFATDTRPQYDAVSGYLESTLFLGVAYRPSPEVRIFAGLSEGFFDGASNQQSPLFEVRQQSRLALGFVWTLKSSEEMIDVVDLGSSN